MLKAIKLEYKKNKKEINVWWVIGFALLTPIFFLLLGGKDVNSMFLILVSSSSSFGIVVFNNRYKKEMRNNTLKNSIINPIGVNKSIKSKIIVSVGLHSLYLLIGILNISLLALKDGTDFNFFALILSLILSININLIIFRIIIKNGNALLPQMLIIIYVVIVSMCNYILGRFLFVYFLCIMLLSFLNIGKMKNENFEEVVKSNLR